MTKERREEVVLVALVASLAIHVGLMFLVRPQVMTRIAPVARRAARTEPMRVTKSELSRPEPVKIETVHDLQAAKDAPAAKESAVSSATAEPLAEGVRVDVPDVELPQPKVPDAMPTTVFDARPAGRESSGTPAMLLTRIETPAAVTSDSPAPDFSVKILQTAAPRLAAVPSVGSAPAVALQPTRLVQRQAPKVDYKPVEKILEKVDERVVTEEKAAVRELVERDDAADLVRFVNLTMTATASGGWTYFKVMMTPRTHLSVVPKDVVMIIDGSGSIGNDRFGSCRKAARRILRTATNSGDRFNLVVFRNSFSYAFRTWRECDAPSFAAGDKWLSDQTAHGRTDVFSTISSVLTLPRDPKRPLIALVVTDGDANAGVSNTAEILSRFTALNDGLVSVYMYGVKSSANRELIDVLTHANRGESFVFDGWRWSAGEGMDGLSERFRDPVLSDLRVIFSAETKAETYPRLLRNLYRGGTLDFVGRVPAGTKEVSFSLKGLNGATAYEGFFRLPFATAPDDPAIVSAWDAERAIDRKLGD